MNESLQSRISKAQIRLVYRQSILASDFEVFKNRMRKYLASPKPLIIACIVGFMFGRYRSASGLIKPVKDSLKPLIRASVVSGYSVIWRRVIDAALNLYKSAKDRQMIPDREKTLT